MRDALADPSVIQVARTRGVPAEYVYPWALIYEHQLEPDRGLWSYCRVIDEQWSKEGERQGAALDRCPHRNVPGDHDNVICPFGFWGFRHVIEQPLTTLRMKDGQYLPFDTPDEIEVGPGAIKVAVGVTRDPALNPPIGGHLQRLSSSQLMQVLPPGAADNYVKVRNLLPAAQLVYFLCHGEFDANLNAPYLGIGLRDADPLHRVYPRNLSEWSDSETPPNLDAWTQQRPLVFINGCHTCNLRPGQMLSFVTALADVQASGVIGTEVSIRLPVAIDVAEIIFAQLAKEKEVGEMTPVGEAVRHMRWQLLNKGSLLGLAYTPYCLSTLKYTHGGV